MPHQHLPVPYRIPKYNGRHLLGPLPSRNLKHLNTCDISKLLPRLVEIGSGFKCIGRGQRDRELPNAPPLGLHFCRTEVKQLKVLSHVFRFLQKATLRETQIVLTELLRTALHHKGHGTCSPPCVFLHCVSFLLQNNGRRFVKSTVSTVFPNCLPQHRLHCVLSVMHRNCK